MGGLQDESFKKHPPFISIDTVSLIADFITEGCKALNIENVSIGFHGGEPMMQKLHEFETMCSLLVGKITQHANLNFTMQSNGMLINNAWINALVKYRVHLGISLDGNKEENDKHRVDKRNRGTYDRVLQGINRLKSSQYMDVMKGVGLLTVINPESNPEKTYYHFTQEIGVSDIDFLLPDITHDQKNSLDAKKYGDYLVRLFNVWINDQTDVRIRIMKSSLDALTGGTSSIYGFGYNSPHILPLITISSDGSIWPVDELRVTAAFHKNRPKNVRDLSLTEFLSTDLIKEIRYASETPPENCMTCCWKQVCFGGNLVSRYSAKNGFNNQSLYCAGLKDFYATLSASLLESGYPYQKIIENLKDRNCYDKKYLHKRCENHSTII